MIRRSVALCLALGASLALPLTATAETDELQTLTVVNLAPAAGSVAGGGIDCGATCSASFGRGTLVPLAVAVNRGYAFAGFGGDCSGPTCTLTMDGPKTVSARFVPFGAGQHLRLLKNKGKAILSFRVGWSGTVIMTGKKVQVKSRALSRAIRVKVPIVAKGKALARLRSRGAVKVGVRVSFAPYGGATAVFTRKLTLRLASG